MIIFQLDTFKLKIMKSLFFKNTLGKVSAIFFKSIYMASSYTYHLRN